MSARRAASWLLGAALLSACPKDEVASRSGLRVPLPPGWVAEEGRAGALKAGPRGRTVLLLEHQGARPLPGPQEFEEVVRAQGGELLEVKRTETAALVRYRVAAGPGGAGEGEARAQAFLGARTLDGPGGPRLFLCASAPAASDAELKVAEGVCKDLKWGGAAQ